MSFEVGWSKIISWFLVSFIRIEVATPGRPTIGTPRRTPGRFGLWYRHFDDFNYFFDTVTQNQQNGTFLLKHLYGMWFLSLFLKRIDQSAVRRFTRAGAVKCVWNMYSYLIKKETELWIENLIGMMEWLFRDNPLHHQLLIGMKWLSL